MNIKEVLKVIEDHLVHMEKGATKLNWQNIPMSVTTYRVGNLIRIDIKSAIPEEV